MAAWEAARHDLASVNVQPRAKAASTLTPNSPTLYLYSHWTNTIIHKPDASVVDPRGWVMQLSSLPGSESLCLSIPSGTNDWTDVEGGLLLYKGKSCSFFL